MKQAAYLLAVLLGTAFVIHSLVYLIPGDPAQMIAGEYASAADIARIRTELNLDMGFFQRYALYVSKLIPSTSACTWVHRRLTCSYPTLLPTCTTHRHTVSPQRAIHPTVTHHNKQL